MIKKREKKTNFFFNNFIIFFTKAFYMGPRVHSEHPGLRRDYGVSLVIVIIVKVVHCSKPA